jgi:hypothetical protein
MAGTRAKALAKMQAAYGYWRPLLSCSSLPTDCSWFRPSSIPRSCMARKCGHDEGGQRQDVSGRKESSPQHSSPASRDCSSDVLYGTLGYFHPVYSLMLCCGKMLNMEAGRWPKEALRFSFEGSRGVGRPKVGTDWCGNVKSITEQIQHT